MASFFSRKKKNVAVASGSENGNGSGSGSGSERKIAIGIDLGTTYSCVGVWHHDRVEIIANDQGNRITPSRVSFTDTERLVGDAAKNDALVNTSNSVYDGKRLIGRRFSDALVQSDMKMWPFKVVRGLKDKPIIEVQYKGKKKQLSAEEISSMVLMKMKQTAEDYLGHTVNYAVVTVPAYFNNSQRHATKDAGTIAGFNVLRIMDEPTAAAVAYGFNELQDGNSFPKNIFVFDLGGGTLDVSLLTVTDSLFEVKATAGDTHLGGEDFDNRMVKHFIEELKRKHKKDITCNARALARLKSVCERAKRCLSSNTMASVQVDSLYDGIDFSSKISQARFDELNMDLFSKCMELVDRCLKDAKIEKQNVDDVVLVGGSTRIVKMQKLLQDYFNGKELCRNIDPDEAVAYGATVQAAKLSGHGNKPVQNLELVDVTPLSLGIDTIGDKMETVVPRNTPIPIRKERVFTTSVHNQTNVSFKAFEGEGALTTSNHLLGMFNLLDIRSAPIGVPKLDVCFDIDADGILNVTALDRRSGHKNNITIKNEQDKLTKADIDRMIADANQYKIEDAENKRKASARNNLENYACEMRSAVENPKFLNTIPPQKKDRVEAAVGTVLDWLDDNQLPDVSDCEVHLKALKLVCDPIIKQ